MATELNFFLREEESIWHKILSVVSEDSAFVWEEIEKGDIEKLRNAVINLFREFEKEKPVHNFQGQELEKLFVELVGKFWVENAGLLAKGKRIEKKSCRKI